MQAVTIILENPLPLWLFPTLFLLGVFVQAAALFWYRRLLLLVGASFVLAAAALDRDLALAVGQVLATAGLWRSTERRPKS